MTIKVYVSGICGSQEVRKRQQRVLFILQTMPIDLEVIDVTEPGREEDRERMQEEVKKHDKNVVLPPQIFNDNEYCGDYADFQLANDDDEVMRFLKLESGGPPSTGSSNMKQNGTGKNDNAQEEAEVIDTTGNILSSPEDENVVIDDGANTIDSDVEMQNLASNEEVEALSDEPKISDTKGKNLSSDDDEESEESE